MVEAATILNQSGSRALVIVDEIGRGTSTFDGLALAGAIATQLHDKTQAFTLFATHYFELTEFPAKHHTAVNVHVSDEQVCVNEATGAALLPPVLTSVGENVDTSSSGSLVPSPESSVQL